MPITVKGLAPLVQVFDMPTSLKFYQDIGFAVTGRSSPDDNCGWAMLELNNTCIMLNTMYEDHDRPPAPDPARTKIHQEDVGLYFGCPDVDAAYEHLRSRGFKVDFPKVMGYGMRDVTVIDPDGYALHFHCPVDKK